MQTFTIINLVILVLCFIASITSGPDNFFVDSGTFLYFYILPVSISVNFLLSVKGWRTNDPRFGDQLTLGVSSAMLVFWGFSRICSDGIRNVVHYLF